MSKLRITYLRLNDLVEWENNPRNHDVPLIAGSIVETGYNDPVELNCHPDASYVLSGHGRIKALWALHGEGGAVPDHIIVKGDDWYLPVIKLKLPPDKAQQYALLANRTTEVGGWDDERLGNVLSDLHGFDVDVSGLGWDGEEIRSLAGITDEPMAPPPEPQVDRAEELREKWGVKHGDLWALCRHRVICGDCTDKAVVERLMGGEKAALLLTDPPYGINVVKVTGATVGGSSPVTIGSVRGRKPYAFGGVKNTKPSATVGGRGLVDATPYRPVEGDDKPFDPKHLIGMAEDMILFGGNYFCSHLPNSRCWIVWDKNNTGRFADAELAYTSFDRVVRLYRFTWNGLVREGERAVEGVHRFHPTQKPVGLFERILADFSETDALVLDPYLGAGTSILACERIGRIGRASEIDPAYIAVTLQRYADMTGSTPHLLES